MIKLSEVESIEEGDKVYNMNDGMVWKVLAEEDNEIIIGQRNRIIKEPSKDLLLLNEEEAGILEKRYLP